MRWLSASHELSSKTRSLLTLLAFSLPLFAWCVVSYVPFVWHPLIEVVHPGDSSVPGQYSYLAQGQQVEREVFEKRNLQLAAAGAELARGFRTNPIYLPAPHEVAAAFVTAFTTEPARHGDVWLHESLWHSCQIIFWGFLYAALLGVPLGIACGCSGLFSRVCEPFIDFIRYMPAPVFGALAVAIFGLGDEPKVTIIFIGTFFQMVLIVANTTRMADIALVEAAQTMGARPHQLVMRVIVPSIVPNLYRDMRILIGWAWTYLVVAELIGEKSGISAFIYQQQRYRHFDNVYASIVVIGMIGLIVDQALAQFGRLLFPWESGDLRLIRLRARLVTRPRALAARVKALRSKAPEAMESKVA